MVKKILFRLSAALLVSGAVLYSAKADEVTFCAGKEGGGYDSVMKAIGAELQKSGDTVIVKNLDGSEAILNSLVDGGCQYGPAQKDISYLLGKNNPALSSSVQASALLYNEVMTLVCSKESEIDELEDMTKDTTVIVDTFGSGSALTWENLVNIEKEYGNGSSWAEATAVYSGLSEAEAAISVGEAQCAFGVSKLPAAWAKQMESDGFTIAYIEDKDINDLEYPKGASLYEAYWVPAGPYSQKFWTYKIPAVLFKSGKSKASAAIDKKVTRYALPIGRKFNTVQ